MFAHMPQHLKGYSMLQVAISNGSKLPCTVRPEDFSYVRPQTRTLPATPANDIVKMLMDRGDHDDVVKLTLAYESVLYGFDRMKFTNGYELRRQNFLSLRHFGATSRRRRRLRPSSWCDQTQARRIHRWSDLLQERRQNAHRRPHRRSGSAARFSISMKTDL